MNIEVNGVIRLLNVWLEMDREGISNLFSNQTIIGKELSDEHRINTVVTQGNAGDCAKCGNFFAGTHTCTEGGDCEAKKYDIYSIDPMDIINGLFGGKRISVVRDEHNRIIRFEQA